MVFLTGNSQEDVSRPRGFEETLAPFKPNETNDGLRNLGMAKVRVIGDDPEFSELSLNLRTMPCVVSTKRGSGRWEVVRKHMRHLRMLDEHICRCGCDRLIHSDEAKKLSSHKTNGLEAVNTVKDGPEACGISCRPVGVFVLTSKFVATDVTGECRACSCYEDRLVQKSIHVLSYMTAHFPSR